MSLIQTPEQIKELYLERSDTLDASSYEVEDLCDEIIRLTAELAAADRMQAATRVIVARQERELAEANILTRLRDMRTYFSGEQNIGEAALLTDAEHEIVRLHAELSKAHSTIENVRNALTYGIVEVPIRVVERVKAVLHAADAAKEEGR